MLPAASCRILCRILCELPHPMGSPTPPHPAAKLLPRIQQPSPDAADQLDAERYGLRAALSFEHASSTDATLFSEVPLPPVISDPGDWVALILPMVTESSGQPRQYAMA